MCLKVGFFSPGGGDHQSLNRQIALWRGQRHSRAALVEIGEDALEAWQGRPELHDAAPMGDALFDRSGGSRQENRSRNDGAGSDFLMDSEIGAERENRRLQEEPQGPRCGGQGAVAIRCCDVIIERPPMHCLPSGLHCGSHPHGSDRGCVAAAFFGGAVRQSRALGGSPEQLAGPAVIEKHETGEQQGADQSENAEIGMQKENHPEINRRPGQIEQRIEAGAAEELTDRIEIAQWMRLSMMITPDLMLEGRGEQGSMNLLVDAPRGPCGNP
jgi:hypothetical protein